jgi:hypothetical protein
MEVKKIIPRFIASQKKKSDIVELLRSFRNMYEI